MFTLFFVQSLRAALPWELPPALNRSALMPPWLSVSRSELLNEGVSLDYVEMWSETDEGRKARKTKAASKTKYTCPTYSLNAWAKPHVLLVCGECQEELQAED